MYLWRTTVQVVLHQFLHKPETAKPSAVFWLRGQSPQECQTMLGTG